MSEFKLGSLLHASVIVSDTQRALAFYHDVLGLQIAEERPDLGYPGAWLWLGEQQIHLLELPNPDPVSGRPAHGGRDRHIAIAVTNLPALKQRLDAHGLEYTVSKSGRAALFVRDPDGNAVELIEQPV
jgi:glyoxylase I family protein